MQTTGKQLNIQHLADRAQALARVSRNPEHKRRAARLQSRADRLRKIDKAVLRYLRSHGVWATFGEVCQALDVPEGAHIRADYASRLVALIAAGKVERQGGRMNVEYRAVIS